MALAAGLAGGGSRQEETPASGGAIDICIKEQAVLSMAFLENRGGDSNQPPPVGVGADDEDIAFVFAVIISKDPHRPDPSQSLDVDGSSHHSQQRGQSLPLLLI